MGKKLLTSRDNDTLFASERLAFVGTEFSGWGKIGMSSYPGLQLAHDGSTFIEPLAMYEMLRLLKEGGVTRLILLPQTKELPINSDVQVTKAAGGLGITTTHIPVVDFGIPDAQGSKLWDAISIDLKAQLAAGNSVGFCCLSGIGRSPSFAARLLCELGSSRRGAIQKIRDRIPYAIETLEQIKWLGRR